MNVQLKDRLKRIGIPLFLRLPIGRLALNAAYAALSSDGRQWAHMSLAKLFRSISIESEFAAEWKVNFENRTIRIPLHGRRMWLDWDLALSAVGHDWHVKASYAAILRSTSRPDVFVDVGANYGMHSLLFLMHGVQAVTFEPNPHCHEVFREHCRYNNVQGMLETVAVGESNARSLLSFPTRDTWLGSINAANSSRGDGSFESCEVDVRPLDSYFDLLSSKRVLLKVDTEGHEASVFRGASRILDSVRPVVVFECLPSSSNRREVFEILCGHGYNIGTLPWSPGQQCFLSHEEFIGSSDGDFVGVPS